MGDVRRFIKGKQKATVVKYTECPRCGYVGKTSACPDCEIPTKQHKSVQIKGKNCGR